MTETATAPKAELRVAQAASGARVEVVGDWRIGTMSVVAPAVEAAPVPPGGQVVIDLHSAGETDISGAWLIHRLQTRLASGGATVTLAGARPETQRLLAAVLREASDEPVPAKEPVNPGIWALEEVGGMVARTAGDFVSWLAILGGVVRGVGKGIVQPRRLRLSSIVHHLEMAGLRSVPIMVLLGFLLGVIIAQQGAFQFQEFVGPDLVVVDLTGYLMLREIGILLAAIMLAGRSGSAITAEIGAMKMREEIDALKVIGLDPNEMLVMPRVVALVIALPLITLLVDIAGLFGGALLCIFYLDMPFDVFVSRLQLIGENTLISGLIKAPFMALVIGVIAASEGLKVGGSADSLGRHTTASVVKSIFMVVVVDGIFAIFFAAVDY